MTDLRQMALPTKGAQLETLFENHTYRVTVDRTREQPYTVWHKGSKQVVKFTESLEVAKGYIWMETR